MLARISVCACPPRRPPHECRRRASRRVQSGSSAKGPRNTDRTRAAGRAEGGAPYSVRGWCKCGLCRRLARRGLGGCAAAAGGFPKGGAARAEQGFAADSCVRHSTCGLLGAVHVTIGQRCRLLPSLLPGILLLLPCLCAVSNSLTEWLPVGLLARFLCFGCHLQINGKLNRMPLQRPTKCAP